MKFLSYKKTYSKLGSTFTMILKCIVLIFAFSIFTIVNNSESVFAVSEYADCTDTEFDNPTAAAFYGFYEQNGTCGRMTNDYSGNQDRLIFSASGGIYKARINMDVEAFNIEEDIAFDLSLSENILRLDEAKIVTPKDLLDYYNDRIVEYYSDDINVRNIHSGNSSAIAIIGDDNVAITGWMGDAVVITVNNGEYNKVTLNSNDGYEDFNSNAPIYFIVFANSATQYPNRLLVLVDIEYWLGYLDLGGIVESSIDEIEIMSSDYVNVEVSAYHDLLTGCQVNLVHNGEVIDSKFTNYHGCSSGETFTFSYNFVEGETYTIDLSVNIYGSYEEPIYQSFVFELAPVTSTCDYGYVVNGYVTTCYENDNNASGAVGQIISSDSTNKMEIKFDSNGGRIYQVGSNSQTAGTIPLSNYEPDLAEKIGLTIDATFADVIEKYNELHEVNPQYQYTDTTKITLVVAKYNSLMLKPIIYSGTGTDVYYYDFSYDGSGSFGSGTTKESIGGLLIIDSSTRIRIIKYTDGAIENLIIIVNKTEGKDSFCIDCLDIDLNSYNSGSINDDDMQCIFTVDSTPLKYVGNSYSECNMSHTEIDFNYSEFYPNGFKGIYYVSIVIVDANNIYSYGKTVIHFNFGSGNQSFCDKGYTSIGAIESGWQACYFNNKSASIVVFNDIAAYGAPFYVSMEGRVYGGVAGSEAIYYDTQTSQVRYYSDTIRQLISEYNRVATTAFKFLLPNATNPNAAPIAVVFAGYPNKRSVHIEAENIVYYDGTTYKYYSDYSTSLVSLLYSPVYMAWYEGTLMIIIDIENYDYERGQIEPNFRVENIEPTENIVDFELIANEYITADYLHYKARINNNSCTTIDMRRYNYRIKLSIRCDSLVSGTTYTLSVDVTDKYNITFTKDYVFVAHLPESTYSNDYENDKATAQYITNFPNEELKLEFDGRIYRVLYGDEAWNLMLSQFEPTIYEYLGLSSATWVKDLIAGYNALGVHGSTFDGGSSNVSIIIANFTSLQMSFSEMEGNTYYSAFNNKNISDGYTSQYFTDRTLTAPIGLNTYPISFIRYSDPNNQQLVIIINKSASSKALCIDCNEVELNNVVVSDNGISFDLTDAPQDANMKCTITVYATNLRYEGNNLSECSYIEMNQDYIFSFWDGNIYIFVLIIDKYGVYVYKEYEVYHTGSGGEPTLDSVCAGYNHIGTDESGWGGCYINTNSQAQAIFGEQDFSGDIIININGRIYEALMGYDALYAYDIQSYVDLYYNGKTGNSIHPEIQPFVGFGVIIADFTSIYFDAHRAFYLHYDSDTGGQWLEEMVEGQTYESQMYFSDYIDSNGNLRLVVVVDPDFMEIGDAVRGPEFDVSNIKTTELYVRFDLNINTMINYDYIQYDVYVTDGNNTYGSLSNGGYNTSIKTLQVSTYNQLTTGVVYYLEVTITDLFNGTFTKSYPFVVESTVTYSLSQPKAANGDLTVEVEISDYSMDGKYICYTAESSLERLGSFVMTDLDSASLERTCMYEYYFESVLVEGNKATITLPSAETSYYIYILAFAHLIDGENHDMVSYFHRDDNTIIGTAIDDNNRSLILYFNEAGKFYARYSHIEDAQRVGDNIEFTISDGYHPSVATYALDSGSGTVFDQTGVSVSWVSENFSSADITNNQFIVTAPGNVYVYILTRQTFVYNPDSIFAQQGMAPPPMVLFDSTLGTPHNLQFHDGQIYSSSTIYMLEFGPFEDMSAPTTHVFDVQASNQYAKHWDGFGNILYTNEGVAISYKFEDISSVYLRIMLLTTSEQYIAVCENNSIGQGRVLQGNCFFDFASFELSDGTYLLNYNVWDNALNPNQYLSSYITIVYDTIAPNLSLDSTSIVTTKSTTPGDIVQAYVLGDNYEASSIFYYTSQYSYLPVPFYTFVSDDVNSTKASSFNQYYLYVYMEHPYDMAGNRIIGTEVGDNQYRFAMSSSVSNIGSIYISDQVHNTFDYDSTSVVLKDHFVLGYNDVHDLEFHTYVSFAIYDISGGMTLKWYTSGLELAGPNNWFQIINTDLGDGEFILVITIEDTGYNVINTLLIKLYIDKSAPIVTIEGASNDTIPVVNVNSNDEVYAYIYDDVGGISSLGESVVYYATPFDVLPKDVFYKNYNSSLVSTGYHVAWSYNEYYLFVGVPNAEDRIGNSLSGTNIVCNDTSVCDFASNSLVYKFIIRVNDYATSNAGIANPDTGDVYTNESIQVRLTSHAKTYGHSHVVVESTVFDTSFGSTPVHDEFIIDINSESSSLLVMSSDMSGEYYVYVLVTIYDSSSYSVYSSFAYYLLIVVDSESPKLSLSEDDEDSYILSGSGGERIQLYYHDNEDTPELSFKYFASATQYNNVNKLDESYFREAQPIILNLETYYLYVLTRGEDMSGNFLSGGGDSITVPYIGPRGSYGDGKWVVIEFIIHCTTSTESVDLISSNKETNGYGGQTYIIKEASKTDLVIVTVNNCTTEVCSVKNILTDSLNEGASFNEIYHTVNNAQGMTTNLYGTTLFTTNNGNLYFPGVAIYSSDGTKGQIIDLLILNNAPVISGGANAGSNLTVNKGEEILTNIGLSFVSVDGSEVSVDTLITFDGVKVKSIDTNKVGTYIVTQIATDAMGRTNKVVREITVLDNSIEETVIIEEEIKEEINEIIAIIPVSSSNETTSVEVKEEVRNEMHQVELHVHEKVKFKGYSKKKMIKKNKKEQFNFKLFSKYFFKVYDG